MCRNLVSRTDKGATSAQGLGVAEGRAGGDGWASALCSGPAVGAVVALLLNDHWLKGAGLLPGWLTGKLSDVAGLFFFPMLCVALWRGVGVWARGSGARGGRGGGVEVAQEVGAAAVTGLVFGLAKTWPGFHASFEPLWGQIVMDPTDLWALIALPLSVWWMRRCDRAVIRQPVPALTSRRARGRLPWGSLAAVLLAAAASVATSLPDGPRNYPLWHVISPGAAAERAPWAEDQTSYRWRFRVATAQGSAWVSKSGREGFGVSLLLRRADVSEGRLSEGATSAPLIPVRVLWARALVGGRVVAAAALPSGSLGSLDEALHLYIPFAFDNLTAWNEGQRAGELQWLLLVGGFPVFRRLALEQAQDGPFFHLRRGSHPWRQ
jgi:hypothetical protein